MNVILVVIKFLTIDYAISPVAIENGLLTHVEVPATIRPYTHLPRRVFAQQEFIATQV